MKCYDQIQPPYLETDAPRVGMAASLLQTRNGTSCPRDKAPDNSMWRTIALQTRAWQAKKKVQ